MVETGKIKSVVITEGECVCEVDFGADQVETCVFYENAGNNNHPLPKDEVAVSLSDGQNTILAVFRPIPDGLRSGEQVIYSRDSDGVIQANIKLADNEEIILNKGDDYAILYNEMKKAFDSLVDFVNNQSYVTTATIGASPTVGIITAVHKPFTESIDSAKAEKVRL